MLLVEPGEGVRIGRTVQLQALRTAVRAGQQQRQRTVSTPAGHGQATLRTGGDGHRPQRGWQLDGQQLEARCIRIFRRRAESAGVVGHTRPVRPGRARDARQPAPAAVQCPAPASCVAGQRVRRERRGAVEQRRGQPQRRKAVAQVDHLQPVGKGQQQHVVVVQRQVQRRAAQRGRITRHLAGKGAEAAQRLARHVPACQRAEAVAQQRQTRQIGLGQQFARGAIAQRRRGTLGAQRQQRARCGLVRAGHGVGRQRHGRAVQRGPVARLRPHPEALTVGVHGCQCVSKGP